VKKLAVIAALCSFAAGCTDKETKTPDVWRRPVEPRLTGVTAWQPCTPQDPGPGQVVPTVRCGAPPATAEGCPKFIDTHAAAVRVLVERPVCVDDAIAALERHARTLPAAQSDLAAAYYLRAQREDDPAQFARAFDEARKAVAQAPRSAAARFNLALVEQALGLDASWDAVLKVEPNGPWADEARKRRDEPRKPDAAARWEEQKKVLPGKDRAAIARVVDEFPMSVQEYFEENVWTLEIAQARRIADAISRRMHGDPYFPHVVAELEQSKDPAAMRAAMQKLSDARARVLGYASADLMRAGSSLHVVADITAAGRLVVVGQHEQAHRLLADVERAVAGRPWHHVRARITAMRGYIYFEESRFLESDAAYESALAEYARLGDQQNAVKIRARLIGTLYTTGRYKPAWREAFAVWPLRTRLVKPLDRHLAIGEPAKAAFFLGHYELALRIQNMAVALSRTELAAKRTKPGDLAIALRTRAGILAALGRGIDARADLTEALPLLASAEEAETETRAIRTRMLEVEGQASDDPRIAIKAFTEALRIEPNMPLTFRASVLTQRAQAHEKLDDRSAAERDFREALELVENEQRGILEPRNRGEDEKNLGPYFSRFKETNQRLIRLLVESGRAGEAFEQAEKVRAYEPLDLILKSPIAPESFRKLDRKNAAALRAALPAGTFLLQYAVLPEHTYVWIVSREHFQVLKLTAPEEDIERWSNGIQAAARPDRLDPDAFDVNLYAPFAELVQRPLDLIRRFNGGRDPQRLVIVPDGAMHSLPFAALRNSVTRKYLIETAPLAIAGSTSLYIFSLMRDDALAATLNQLALLFGDPAFDPHLPAARGRGRLSGAQKEVEAIARLYPGAQRRIAESATTEEFLRLVRGHAIVHFAGHAVADVEAPWLSLLLLTRPLTAEELMKKLESEHTRLMVLAACKSAGGAPVGAEGLAPLVRPLIVSGIPGVVGTLWDVNDATSEKVLVSFHRHYRNGKDAAAALQAAQVEMLRKSDPASALVWAPFQVIGHAASPFAAPLQKKEKPP
jgi:CHAT domain-containing protein